MTAETVLALLAAVTALLVALTNFLAQLRHQADPAAHSQDCPQDDPQESGSKNVPEHRTDN